MRSWCRLYIYPRYTDLCPQCTGSSGIVPRRGISYSDASFSAPPFEKSAQCSCGYTEQRSSLYCRQSLKLGLGCFYWKTISLFPVSFPDHPKKWKEGLVFWVTLTWRELLEKECCNCSETPAFWQFRWLQSVNYKTWEGHEVSRDSWEQAVRQRFFLYPIQLKLWLLMWCTITHSAISQIQE